jgi:hypothetical protein
MKDLIESIPLWVYTSTGILVVILALVKFVKFICKQPVGDVSNIWPDSNNGSDNND